jgi:hypothetical protein
MPFPESQRPQCHHKACKEFDRYAFEVQGRKYRLIYEACNTNNQWLHKRLEG